MGGELSSVPKVAQEFELKGETFRWRRTESEYFDVVNLSEEFPEKNIIVLFLTLLLISIFRKTVLSRLQSAALVRLMLLQWKPYI